MQQPNSEFINLEVKVSVLKRMLKRQSLHLCDVHCHDAQDKVRLQQILLQAITEGGSNGQG